MSKNTKLSDAIHTIALIEINPFDNLTSARIAKSINTNPSFIRQIMSKLKKSGLITNVIGHAEPKLKKSPKDISLWDIATAIDQTKFIYVDTHIDPKCGPGQNIQASISDYYDSIEFCAEQRMKNITLQDILDSYNLRLHEHPEYGHFE